MPQLDPEFDNVVRVPDDARVIVIGVDAIQFRDDPKPFAVRVHIGVHPQVDGFHNVTLQFADTLLDCLYDPFQRRLYFTAPLG